MCFGKHIVIKNPFAKSESTPSRVATNAFKEGVHVGTQCTIS